MVNMGVTNGIISCDGGVDEHDGEDVDEDADHFDIGDFVTVWVVSHLQRTFPEDDAVSFVGVCDVQIPLTVFHILNARVRTRGTQGTRPRQIVGVAYKQIVFAGKKG